VQIAAADPVVQHSQLHFAGADGRLRNILQTQIFSTVENGCAHDCTRVS